MKNSSLALIVVLATVGTAHAQSAPSPSIPLHFMSGIGGSIGGDNLATAEYANGAADHIKAGSGAYYTAGADYRLRQELSVQGTLNFHVDENHASNGSIKFQRFPLELLAYYHVTNEWRLGGGVRYVTGAKVSGSGSASGIHAKFDNTVSGVVETEYFWAPNFGVKLRYVNESYKLRGYGEVNANHYGISVNYYF